MGEEIALARVTKETLARGMRVVRCDAWKANLTERELKKLGINRQTHRLTADPVMAANIAREVKAGRAVLVLIGADHVPGILKSLKARASAFGLRCQNL